MCCVHFFLHFQYNSESNADILTFGYTLLKFIDKPCMYAKRVRESVWESHGKLIYFVAVPKDANILKKKSSIFSLYVNI